jgi:Ca2+-binding RTX toxin-like protein
MLVSMLAALMLASPVALTEIINGDNRDNLLRGTARTDQIRGYGGNDKIQGEGARDRILGDGEGAQRLGPLHTHTVSLLLGVSAKAGVSNGPGLPYAPIHRSAWKGNSQKLDFRLTEF